MPGRRRPHDGAVRELSVAPAFDAVPESFQQDGENGTGTSGLTDASDPPGRARCGPDRRTARACRSRGTGTSDPDTARTRRLSAGTAHTAVRVARLARVARPHGSASRGPGCTPSSACGQHPTAEHERRRRSCTRQSRRWSATGGRGGGFAFRGGGLDRFLFGNHIDHGVLRRDVVNGGAGCHSRIVRRHRPVQCLSASSLQRGSVPLGQGCEDPVSHTAAGHLLDALPRSAPPSGAYRRAHMLVDARHISGRPELHRGA